MKFKKNQLKTGYTLIELMLVVAIISVLASIVSPRFDLLLQKAQQSSCKGNLGAIRTAIGLYYSDHEGFYPLFGYADGFPDTYGESLSAILCPKYIGKLPTPKLFDRAGNFNGTGLDYDGQAKISMEASNPVKDVLIFSAAPGPTPGINRPFVYDPRNGFLYICNDNFDTAGDNFFSW